MVQLETPLSRVLPYGFGLAVSATARLAGPTAARALARASLHSLYRGLGNGGDPFVRACEVRIPPSVCKDVQVEVTRHGVRMNLALEDNAQRVMYFTGSYEKQFTEWLLSSLHKDDVFLDIGAHVGIHALPAARRLKDLGGGKVFSVEATPDSARKIRESAKLNALDNIEVVQVGLGDHEGMLRLYTDDRYPKGDAGVRSQFNSGALVCETRLARLDDIATEIGLHRIDIVKLDIEGGELAALRGMEQTLRALKPRFIAIEIDELRLGQAGTTEAEISDLLRKSGYKPSGLVLLTNWIYELAQPGDN